MSERRQPADVDLLYYLGMAHYQRKQFDLNFSDKFADETRRALSDFCQEPQ